MKGSLWWPLLLMPFVILLSACPVSPRSAGEKVGGELRQGQVQANQFLQGVEKGYANPSATPDSVSESIGKLLKKGQKEAEQFWQGVQSGYKNH